MSELAVPHPHNADYRETRHAFTHYPYTHARSRPVRMNIADVVKALAKAGCTPDQIAIAVEELTSKRSSAAERQARYRERNKAKQGETTVTDNVTLRDVTTAPLSPFIPPDKEIPPTPPKEINPPIIPQTPNAGAADFAEFWSVYPNRVGKRAAEKSFLAARKRVSQAELMDGLRAYVAKQDDRPWCNPATWLNQDRWGDRPAPVHRNPVGAEHFFAAAERMRNEREYREANSGDRWNADGFPVLSLEHKGRDG